MREQRFAAGLRYGVRYGVRSIGPDRRTHKDIGAANK